MSNCERIQEQLPEYIAAGEPASVATVVPNRRDVSVHLSRCSLCQAYARDLRLVEQALHAYPLVSPPPSLVAAILERVMHEDQIVEEEWHLLPWDIWVPLAAFALALMIAVMSMPPHLLDAATIELEANIRQWPTSLAQLVGQLGTGSEQDLFWALWSGFFATTAGLGIGFGLANLHAAIGERLSALEDRVSSVASRLLDHARHID